MKLTREVIKAKCDFCKDRARFDDQTKAGPWAYMCEHHHKLNGVGKIGYILKWEKDEQE